MLTLFDFDGTLSDTRDAIIAGLRTLVADRLEQPPSDDVLLAHVQQGMSLHATIRSLHPEPAAIEHEIDDWAHDYRTAYADEALAHERLFDGALEAVQHAATLGDVVIVSMKHSDELGRSIERAGMSQFVEAFFGDDGVTPLKPSPALWHDAIAPAFADHVADRTIMIGDTGHDLHFAHNANLRSCWASYGYGDPSKCRDAGFDFEAADPTALKHVLNQMSVS